MFKIEKKRDEKIFILSIQGYCEAEAGKEIFDAINEAFSGKKPAGVIFDFSENKVINSCCVAQLIEAMELITCDFRTDVVFCGIDKTKVALFKMVGMLELAEVTDDLVSAKKYLAE
ncbi:MAG: hypothetical protein KKB51_09805 [Candidatus Riflebacteria bacterium]|nr:hypothetical protein [Candidatus Riflebacteria bacterium]